ncbi:MAG: L-seryl-tRNA(Sec) selenium transferase [Deltaproteobacteria bacterium]|nr:L-seryl-tRNA(Sec) selenium transferase [Deltaproteobacteria bacterium]
MDSSGKVKHDPRRDLPQADRLIRCVRDADPALASWAAAAGARATLRRAREALEAGPERPVSLSGLTDAALREARRLARGHPHRVVNATGVVLHTNLGRAPIAAGAAAAAAAAASTYTDLELDLGEGRRGDRLSAVADKLVLLSGAEAAHAVNNCAAALLLALDTLARGKEVIVSRGELVEIGGSFRIPEIVERAGVRLREVGTTNRTHPIDYERAIGPQTGALLKVHRSNFDLRGFTSEVGLETLRRIGASSGLPVIEDLGSGTLLEAPGLAPEGHAPSRLRLGADLVLFSADKLLGGPQAGIVLGRRTLVAAMRASPLDRALRLDKQTLAALDWTLAALLEGREQEIPTLRMLSLSEDELDARARSLAQRLCGCAASRLVVEIAAERAPLGGGSLPGVALETRVVRLRGAAGRISADGLAQALRSAEVPVIARVHEDAVLLDVRTLLPGDEEAIEAALRFAFAP